MRFGVATDDGKHYRFQFNLIDEQKRPRVDIIIISHYMFAETMRVKCLCLSIYECNAQKGRQLVVAE